MLRHRKISQNEECVKSCMEIYDFAAQVKKYKKRYLNVILKNTGGIPGINGVSGVKAGRVR